MNFQSIIRRQSASTIAREVTLAIPFAKESLFAELFVMISQKNALHLIMPPLIINIHAETASNVNC
jgi:hypothetical protein